MGHGIGGSIGSLETSHAAVSPPVASSDAKAEKWKQGARKTLLNWVSNAIPKYVYKNNKKQCFIPNQFQ